MSYLGRGAWAPIGGTLKRVDGKAVPGPYYMRPTKGVLAPGVLADEALTAGAVPDLNEHAVWFGVLAIKTRLKELVGLVYARELLLNGRYGTQTAAAVKEFQGANGLTPDGVVGPATARALFLPVVKDLGTLSRIGWQVGCGLVTNESAWDPGAVGRSDPDDWGLCQLNYVHQSVTRLEAFTVRVALGRLFDLLDRNLATFGHISDAVAAYNLGKTGCQLWISEGRPQWFIPLAQRDDPDAKPRDVWAYIDRIQTAC